ncbi:TIGR03862 family flavoprotein [Saliniramus sp.]|uniref:NAD(P)/FAD-dependent oxidoreductase n=1 Tax=Saliniramus sp. TaxID=2986772 RepID=UPI002CB66337|nr:TIGR03862 family flavoprotein [Saliniramus sp.]HMB12278.1 TIGR03862 family flavoprotein [Saliniramus sp.]
MSAATEAADGGVVAIIGAGPAGLMAAQVLAERGHAVVIFERMPSPARKFLLAGRGGLNLTHSEAQDVFLKRYGAPQPQLTQAIATFTPQHLRDWSTALGEPTFVGSSGRVFPKSFKASPLARAWLARLAGMGVTLKTRHRFTGFDGPDGLVFETPDGVIYLRPAATLLALGGASWARLGSDGAWTVPLGETGVAITPLAPSNVGCEISWSETFRARFAGAPLKRIALACGDMIQRGEAVVTETGLEGGAVYALSQPLREQLVGAGAAQLVADLRPDLSVDEIAAKLARAEASKRSDTLTNRLRKALALDPAAIGLLREAHGVDLPRAPEALAAAIKAVPLTVTGLRPIDRAISSAGGVAFSAIDDAFMLKARPGTFIAGEMLDWEAPTGGYLLQACFATGIAAGEGIAAWLRSRESA